MLFFLIPVIVLFLLRKNLSDFGLNLKQKKLSLMLAATLFLLVSPFIFYIAAQPDFQGYYPLWKEFGTGSLNILFAEALLLIPMISTEFFFRGFMLFGLKSFGKNTIIIQTIPYILIHLGKPNLELIISSAAGIFFGFVAYKTKSVLPSAAAHWGLATLLDVLVLNHTL